MYNFYGVFQQSKLLNRSIIPHIRDYSSAIQAGKIKESGKF